MAACADLMSVGFRNMSTFNKLKNQHAASTRSYIFAIWNSQGFDEIIIDYWMYVDVWLQPPKTNMTIHLPSSFFLINEKVLQEVVSKNPILKFVVDLNINGVAHYQHYYNNKKKKISPSKILMV